MTITLLLCGFALVLIERNRIRAHWWAWQLTRTEDPSKQAYYLGSLAAVGDAARGAAERLAGDERAGVRALAVIALARLPDGTGADTLGRLLGDEDQEVAESAAESLAFIEGDPAAGRAQGLLIEAVVSNASGVSAAAAAALSRVKSRRAVEALCGAARDHPAPLVRAQAIESLAAVMLAAKGSREPLPPAAAGSDPVSILVGALTDQATFIGSLSLERQIAAASAFAGDRGTAAASGPAIPTISAGRTVAEIAAEYLERLTGQRIEHATPRTAAQLAALAEECRGAIVEGGGGPGIASEP